MFESEQKLVNAFIQNHVNKGNLIEECDFRWGNIDVVEYETNDTIFLSSNQVKVLRNNRNLLVFSCLYRKRGLRLESISTKSGLPLCEVARIIKKLTAMNIVLNSGNTYIINPLINFPDIKVHAYEMKQTDIRKAINQASINQTFCDYSYIVFAHDKNQLCQKYYELLVRNGIGLILVDDNYNNVVIRARKSKKSGILLLNSKIKLIESRLNF